MLGRLKYQVEHTECTSEKTNRPKRKKKLKPNQYEEKEAKRVHFHCSYHQFNALKKNLASL